MKIALVGYGKMGHMVEQCAKRAGHEVVVTIDTVSEDAMVKITSGDTEALTRAVKSSGAEGIIEFSHPSVVIENIKALLPLGLPLIVGTTGWNDKHKEIADYITDVMSRGVTVLNAQGWYTKQQKDVLLIIINQKEFPQLSKVIKDIDPRAFMSISPTRSVYGEGFEEIKTGVKLKKKKES